MTEFKKEYRYHPESEDTVALCQELANELPSVQFSHSYVRDLNGSTLLQIKAQSEGRYYAQTLRDSQEPEDIAKRFINRLKPRNPKPTTELWFPR